MPLGLGTRGHELEQDSIKTTLLLLLLLLRPVQRGGAAVALGCGGSQDVAGVPHCAGDVAGDLSGLCALTGQQGAVIPIT